MNKDRQDIIKKAVIENIYGGCYILEACDKAKISRSRYYVWITEDKNFKNAVDQALLSCTLVVENALFKKAKEGNVTAQIFWLCNRTPDRWESLQKIEHMGEIKTQLSLSSFRDSYQDNGKPKKNVKNKTKRKSN